MAELIGLIASVVQVASTGLKLSKTLYEYADGVATADRRIRIIAREIELTSCVIEQLGAIFKDDETATLMSESGIKTANATMKECSAIFAEIEEALKKSKKNSLGKFLLPFRDSKIELMRSHIDKLKSTLHLIMQLLTHAQQIAAKKLSHVTEKRQRAQIQFLIDAKNISTKKYEKSLKDFSENSNLSIDSTSTLTRGSLDSSQDLIFSTTSIGSSINSKTLDLCVKHVRDLLQSMETLQQALTSQAVGADHSEHQQNMIGSYYLTREHLDSVLLGNSRTSQGQLDVRASKTTRLGSKLSISSAQRLRNQDENSDSSDHELSQIISSTRSRSSSTNTTTGITTHYTTSMRNRISPRRDTSLTDDDNEVQKVSIPNEQSLLNSDRPMRRRRAHQRRMESSYKTDMFDEKQSIGFEGESSQEYHPGHGPSPSSRPPLDSKVYHPLNRRRPRSQSHVPVPNVTIYNTTRMDNESSPNVRTEQRDSSPYRRRQQRRIPREWLLEDQIAELERELERDSRDDSRRAVRVSRGSENETLSASASTYEHDRFKKGYSSDDDSIRRRTGGTVSTTAEAEVAAGDDMISTRGFGIAIPDSNDKRYSYSRQPIWFDTVPVAPSSSCLPSLNISEDMEARVSQPLPSESDEDGDLSHGNGVSLDQGNLVDSVSSESRNWSREPMPRAAHFARRRAFCTPVNEPEVSIPRHERPLRRPRASGLPENSSSEDSKIKKSGTDNMGDEVDQLLKEWTNILN